MCSNTEDFFLVVVVQKDLTLLQDKKTVNKWLNESHKDLRSLAKRKYKSYKSIQMNVFWAWWGQTQRSEPLTFWIACRYDYHIFKTSEFIMISKNICRHHQHVKMCFYGYAVRGIYKPIMTFIAYGNSRKIMPLGVTWWEQISVWLIDHPLCRLAGMNSLGVAGVMW